MGASDWLSALNFPASAETTSTLGTDRLDTREPPTQYHLGGLQITRMKELLTNYSSYFAGMTRVRLSTTSGTQFAAGEHGFQISSTVGYIVHGTATPEAIVSAALTAKGDLVGWTGSAFGRLAVGTNGQVLTADSSATYGIAWSGGAITDPGNAGAIPVTQSGVCNLTSAGAETRTIAIPSFAGQTLTINCNVYVGNIVVTSSQAINQAGNTIMTFGAVRDCLNLEGVLVGGALRWWVRGNDGVALS